MPKTNGTPFIAYSYFHISSNHIINMVVELPGPSDEVL